MIKWIIRAVLVLAFLLIIAFVTQAFWGSAGS